MLVRHDDNSFLSEKVFFFDSSDVKIWKILQKLDMLTENNFQKISSYGFMLHNKSIKLINKIDTLSIENKRRYIQIMLDNDILSNYNQIELFINVGFFKPQNIEAFIRHYISPQQSLLYKTVLYLKKYGLEDQESFNDLLKLNDQELQSLYQGKEDHMSTKATHGESISTISLFTNFKVKASQRTLHEWLLEVGLTDQTEGCIETNGIVDVLKRHWSFFSIEQKKSYLQSILRCDFLLKANYIVDEMSQINLLTPTNDLTCLNAVLQCVSIVDILKELLSTSLLRTQRKFENLEKVISHDYPAELSSAITTCNQAGLLTNIKAQVNFNLIIELKDLTVFNSFKNLDHDEVQANFDNILLMKDDESSVSLIMKR